MRKEQWRAEQVWKWVSLRGSSFLWFVASLFLTGQRYPVWTLCGGETGFMSIQLVSYSNVAIIRGFCNNFPGLIYHQN